MVNYNPRGTIHTLLHETRGKSFSVQELTESALHRDQVYTRYAGTNDLDIVAKGYKSTARSILQSSKVQYLRKKDGTKFDERQWISYSTDGSKRNARWIDIESAGRDHVVAHGALRLTNANQTAAESKNWQDKIVAPLATKKTSPSWTVSNDYTIG